MVGAAFVCSAAIIEFTVPQLVNLTHGIFKNERWGVWHVEIMTAVDAGKPIILVNQGGEHAFDMDSKDAQGRLLECVDGVNPEFQPVACAILPLSARLASLA